ncbi:short-chain dehydrogenase TIC 32, chloroplastic [Tanacetum coccineum]
MWIFGRKGESGFSASSTAEEVTDGIDGSGLVSIVTGATSGIGAETARVLALRGVHVVMASLFRPSTTHTNVSEAYDPLIKITSYEQQTEGKIINVSSGGHCFVRTSSGIFSDRINDESSYNNVYAYGRSKLANILHANELARRFKEERINITANSLHPGFIITEIFRGYTIFSVIVNKVLKYFVKDVTQGAATTCYLALNPKVKGVTGEYFSDSNLAEPSTIAKDQELAEELWNFSMGLTSSK